MTRQEFKKFIKSLSKEELIQIVYDLTSGKVEAQQRIYLEYSKEDVEFDEREILERFEAIPKQVFTKNYMRVGSSEVGKYCRLANKLITTYIEPLIKRKKYLKAASLLQSAFYSVVEELDWSLYNYESSSSFFNKIEKDFKKIITGAGPVEKIKIARLIEDNMDRDYGDPWFHFGMGQIFSEYFNSPEWDEEKREVLEERIRDYLEEMDDSKPVPDEFSELALELLKLKVEEEAPEEEIREYLEKYKFLGDIIRYEAEEDLRQKKPDRAISKLREAESLPTLSNTQLQKNSDLLISILKSQSSTVGDNGKRGELLEELRKNLDSFYQKTPENLITYLLYTENLDLEPSYKKYKDLGTTKDLYADRFMEQMYKIIVALKTKSYRELDKWNDSSIAVLADYETDYVAQYFIDRINTIMKEPANEKNYREAGKKLKVLWSNPVLRPYYKPLKKELLQKYKRRSKLKGVFQNVESGWYF